MATARTQDNAQPTELDRSRLNSAAENQKVMDSLLPQPEALESELAQLDLASLSKESGALPAIFTDYFFHTGPLRADPPPTMEWPQRLPDSDATPKHAKKYKEKLSDLRILAATCLRAQQQRQYANCFMAMGIIHDNCKDYKAAIAAYKEFVRVVSAQVQPNSEPDESQSQSQTQQSHNEFDLGLYAAFNALGVDYQLLGDASASMAALSMSLEFHLRYRDCIIATESNVMNDTNCNSALFIAYSNLGLLLLRMRRTQFALNQFQHALRYSIHINSSIAQSIAICNISLANVCAKSFSVARCCMERYLQLVTVLGDVQSQCYAFYNLGTMVAEWVRAEMNKPQPQNKEDPTEAEFVASQVAQHKIKEKKNIADALYFLTEAIKVCQYLGDKQLLNQLKMKLAVTTVLQTQL